MKCQLCGYDFDKDALICHSKCPMANGCHIICCPNCGYQVVDETKSGTLNMLRKVKEVFSGWQTTTDNQQ